LRTNCEAPRFDKQVHVEEFMQEHQIIELDSKEIDTVGGAGELQSKIVYAVGYILGDMLRATVENPDFGPKW